MNAFIHLPLATLDLDCFFAFKAMFCLSYYSVSAFRAFFKWCSGFLSV